MTLPQVPRTAAKVTSANLSYGEVVGLVVQAGQTQEHREHSRPEAVVIAVPASEEQTSKRGNDQEHRGDDENEVGQFLDSEQRGIMVMHGHMVYYITCYYYTVQSTVYIMRRTIYSVQFTV